MQDSFVLQVMFGEKLYTLCPLTATRKSVLNLLDLRVCYFSARLYFIQDLNLTKNFIFVFKYQFFIMIDRFKALISSMRN